MKKLVLLSGVSLGLLSACGGVSTVPVEATTTASPGTLIGYESASTYDAQYLNEAIQKGICPNGTDCTTNLANLASDFNYQAGSVVNSVNNYSILYSTSGVLAESREVSGGVIIPNLPESQIKGIVLYYHETEVSKSDVPSCFHNGTSSSYCVSDDPQTYGEELGGIIASEGYIVVMPDYVGLGFDKVVMHPYVLYPQVNALSGLYMLQATNTMLNQLGYLRQQPLNLYIAGFSEGGAYSMWASDMLQNLSPNFLTNTGFNLKATIAMSGAYDIANAQMPMEESSISEGDSYNIANNDNATYAKPVLTAYTMSSYGFYDLNQSYDAVFNTEAGNGFYYCFGCSDVFGALYKVPELFIKNGLNDSNIKSALYQSAISVSYGPQNANNSVLPLINNGILTDQNFNNSLESASILSWKTTTPITLIDLAQDSVVTNLNTQNAYNGLVAQSGTELIHEVTIENTRGSSHYMLNSVDPITGQTALMPLDHIGSSYYQVIAAMNAINQYQQSQ